MNMISVSSTNLAAVGHDDERNVLRVAFRNGGTYEYYDVPKQEFDALMAASSHGQYLAQHIKGRFRYAKI